MDFLIAALAMWHRRRPEAPPLIWTGLSPEALKARAARMPAEARRRVLLETYREPEFLEALHRGALALVFPSLDEGFGFPPLEAMARGTPVVCAERRPMTDLLGDAPLWFDPVDSASLWGALDRLIDEPGLRERTIERGRRQVHRFSWLECARRTYRLYCHLLESDW
jgi:glycosyltransferase involved in cell wall biosynthesis